MIKISLKETDGILNALASILSKELPVKISYSLSKLFATIKAENDLFNDERGKLINKYAERDKDNKVKLNKDGSIPLLKGTTSEFQTKYDELCNIEFEIDFNPIKLDDLKLETIKGLDLWILEKFITS